MKAKATVWVVLIAWASVAASEELEERYAVSSESLAGQLSLRAPRLGPDTAERPPHWLKTPLGERWLKTQPGRLHRLDPLATTRRRLVVEEGAVSLTVGADRVGGSVLLTYSRSEPPTRTRPRRLAEVQLEGRLDDGSYLLGKLLPETGELRVTHYAQDAKRELSGLRVGEGDAASTPYVGLSASAKGDALWRAIVASEYAPGDMPDVASRGGLSSALDDSVASLVLSLLRRGYTTKGDQRPERHKIFHTFGAVARVVFEPGSGAAADSSLGLDDRLLGAPPRLRKARPLAPRYSGLLASGGEGLLRLSLGAGEGFYMPGAALKLFVDGHESADVLAIPGFGPRADKHILHPNNPLTNDLAPPTGSLGPLLRGGMRYFSLVAEDPLFLSVAPLCVRRSDGAPASRVTAPRALVFRPVEATYETLLENQARDHVYATDAATRVHVRDFRVQLAKLPEGTPLYEVYARAAPGTPELRVGTLRLRSRFVASRFGDRALNFEHTGATVEPGWIERLGRLPGAVLSLVDRRFARSIEAHNSRLVRGLRTTKELGARAAEEARRWSGARRR